MKEGDIIRSKLTPGCCRSTTDSLYLVVDMTAKLTLHSTLLCIRVMDQYARFRLIPLRSLNSYEVVE